MGYMLSYNTFQLNYKFKKNRNLTTKNSQTQFIILIQKNDRQSKNHFIENGKWFVKGVISFTSQIN